MWRKKLLVVAMSLSMLLPMGVATGAPADQAPADPAARYQEKAQNVKDKADKKITTQQRQEAAAVSIQQGQLNPLMLVGTDAAVGAAALINDAPHYFSHPNYANSPLPEVTAGSVITVGNELLERAYATDNSTNVMVVLPQELPDGMIQSFEVLNQASAGSSSSPSAGRTFHAYVLRPTGVADEYLVVFDSGLLTMPDLADPTVSEVATFAVANLAVQAGDQLAFYGSGVPIDIGTAGDAVYYPVAAGPVQNSTVTLGVASFPALGQDRTYSFAATVFDLTQASITGGIEKFKDGLPGLGAAAANALGQYIPVAVPDTTTYTIANGFDLDADYYEIAVVEYQEQMHSDLPPTTLRGYVQLGGTEPLFQADGVTPILMPGGSQAMAVDVPHYLGPTIIAQENRPVRIKFYNLLPTGADGNLFIPVDSTVMGSGLTPTGHEWEMANPGQVDPLKPICSEAGKDAEVAAGNCYADNRAVVHLHGGITPWISDGTPHQWITPAGENTAYPEGVSVENVPDMNGCEAADDGCVTLYYTNQQSARLMFYHDHAWGITRLNVYAGMAAPYIIQDDTEQALLDANLIPAAADTIPLVVQDKTFVPNDAQLLLQDETWDTTRWGGEGGLWVPHVYSPAQNPGVGSGVNEFGRWAYGPWFWPPTNSIENGPIPNEYYDPTCDPDVVGWCEPALMPGTPYNSMGMESFNDTPTVNGTAYPTLTVDPKAYRFRILNAANDRFFNLSLYQAMDANGVLCDATNAAPAAESTGVACTEVMLNPAEVEAALTDPAGVFPTPVVGTEGPEWIQIASEGGFLPAPVVIPAQPTTWVTDPTVFNAGNVDQHSLLMAPAERTDVIVDFSAYAGQTLILYNDAPAAFPARDPRYDYYTGNPDLRDIGGAPSTLPGYGPNTRTVMQIKVADAPAAPAFNLAALETAFAHGVDADGNGTGVFESGQNPIHVGQGAYNSAYGTNFQNNGPLAGLVQIFDTSITFDRLIDRNADLTVSPPLNVGPPYDTSQTSAERLTITLRGKMIQDEMGEAFEHEYGRMSGFLGVETPNPQAGQQNMILHPYTFPPTEILDGVELPQGTEMLPIATFDDGTQIWKITHNGVDTHPIHFHLYDVQLINRVGWDGIIRKPEPNELGWKDTVRVSPLEDTIVAMRPVIPQLPPSWQGDQGLPNSIRLLDPSMGDGAIIDSATAAQEALNGVITSFNPDGEPIDVINHYVNFGWEYVLHCHILSHEEMDMMHAQAIGIAPAAPTFDNATGAVRSGKGNNQQYALTWTDNSTNETGFVIERRVAGSADPWVTVATVLSSELGTPSSPLGTLGYVENGVGPGVGTRTWVDALGNDRNNYEYQVYAINVIGDVWDYSDPALNNIQPGGGFPTLRLDSRDTTTPGLTTLAAPTGLVGSAVQKNKKAAIVTLTWTDNAGIETGYLVQRADNALFSVGVVNSTLGPNTETFDQTVARGRTYYYRVYAFSDTLQSDWSNTEVVTTP